MTLTEATAELDKYLDLDLDSKDGSSPTAQQKADVLWKAAKDVYQEVSYKFTTVSFAPDLDDQQIALTDDAYGTTPKLGAYMFGVDDVFINSYPIQKYGYREFIACFPKWRSASSGTPYVFTVTPDSLLIFDKPFSTAALLLDDIFITGPGAPRRFDGTVDAGSEWAVTDLLRWAVIRRACEFSSEAYTRHPEALMYLQRIGQLADRDLTKFRNLTEERDSILDSPSLNDPERYLRF